MMSELDKVPELKQILGAMVFAAKRPLSIAEIRRCLKDVATEHGKETAVFLDIKNSEIKTALSLLGDELEKGHYGFRLGEVAGGYRLQSDVVCGRWLRQMLAIGKPNRLSRPGLETLSIIAYRQPVARSEIEGVRGVSVDHIIKVLMEMQLVRIVGRSDLPGRPLLYGTTQAFLEHFGLKSLKDLNDMEPMLLMRRDLEDPEDSSTKVSETDSVEPEEQALAPQEDAVESDEEDRESGEHAIEPGDEAMEPGEEDGMGEETDDDGVTPRE